MGAQNLTVVGFKGDMFRASAVLNELKSLSERVVDLSDAVAVYRGYNGELRVDQSYQLTTDKGAALGGLFGSLVGAVLAIPFTAGVSAAAAAGALVVGALTGGALGAGSGAMDASWWKDEFGISEDFVEQVGEMIQPGDSAIFVLLRTADPELMAAQFRGYGGTIVSTTLTPAQRAKVERVLQGKAA